MYGDLSFLFGWFNLTKMRLYFFFKNIFLKYMKNPE